MKPQLGTVTTLAFIACFLTGGVLKVFSRYDMSDGAHVALSILLVAATLWISELIPLFVTSFVVLFLSIVWLAPELEGAGVEPSVFLAPFFSDVILLFLGGFVLSAALRKFGIDEDVASRIIARTGGSIPLLIASIMGVTAFLSMWLSNTATTAMMLGLCLPMVNGLPAVDKYRKALLLSIPLAANVGGLGTPIGSPPNAIAMQYLSSTGDPPSFGLWLLIGVPAVVIMLAVAWLTLMLLFRGESTKLALDDKPRDSVYSGHALFVLAIVLVTVLGWLTGAWHGHTSGTVALIPVLALFGTGILNVSDLRSLSWDVLFVMGGGLCLGAAIQVSGLAEWLVDHLPVDEPSAYLVVIVFGITGCIMSSLMSNTATANLLMPIILGVQVEPLGPILVGVAFTCSLAMPLPISTPPNAIAFSTGDIAVKDMLKVGSIVTVIGVALTLTVGWWWWGLVGFR